MGLFSKAEGLANRVVTWLTLLGFLSAGFGWLSSKLTPMRGFGWADFAALGIGAALLTMLVLAVVLAAWRYFNPLPFNERRDSSSDVGEQGFARLESQIQRVAQNAHGIQNEVAEIAPAVRAMQRERFLADYSEDFERIIPRLEQAMEILMNEYRQAERLPITRANCIVALTNRNSAIGELNNIIQASFGIAFNPAEQEKYFANPANGDEMIQDPDVKQRYRQIVDQRAAIQSQIAHFRREFQNHRHDAALKFKKP